MKKWQILAFFVGYPKFRWWRHCRTLIKLYTHGKLCKFWIQPWKKHCCKCITALFFASSFSWDSNDTLARHLVIIAILDAFLWFSKPWRTWPVLWRVFIYTRSQFTVLSGWLNDTGGDYTNQKCGAVDSV